MDTECNQKTFEFPSCKKRKVKADFSGGEVSSDGGVLLLREADRRLGLMKEASKVIPDDRQQLKCDHSLLSFLQQRVYGLCLGYEDLNDHDHLRNDQAFQTAVNRDESLASSSTLCRFENKINRQVVFDLHRVIVDNFIASFSSAPEELILDFDATDDSVHGNQEGKFFHGYYDHYCFLPLYVFCGDELLVSYLRPSKIDGARHSLAILSLLVKRLREAWPSVRIILRADSGFCRHRLMSWCDRKKVYYILGLSKNEILKRMSEPLMQQAKEMHELSDEKVRLFSEFQYGAKTWGKKRRVIVKAEMLQRGENLRFIVTNLGGSPSELYDGLYTQRGDSENRIKEQQLMLFADRTSATKWWTNQFRLLLSSLAYTLVQAIRRLALKGTELCRAQVQTIRLKLLKIGTVIIRNTRKIWFRFTSAYPYKKIFQQVVKNLSTA